MRKLRNALLAGAAAALALGSVASASTDAALAITSVDAGAEVVTITVTAPAELAGRVLTEDELTVTEDGTPTAARIDRISTEGLEVVVVIDSSGSMAGAPMAGARAAAGAFVRDLSPGIPVAIMDFGASPRLALAAGHDVLAQVAAIDAITPAGETALYDAVLAATRLPRAPGTTRRAIVVLSDGGDTVSAATLDEAVAGLQATRTSASVVELASPESDRIALDRIAAAGGGRVVGVGDPAALSAAFASVRSDLTGSYRVVVRPTAAGPTTYAVRLRSGDIDVTATETVDLPAPAGVPERAVPTTASVGAPAAPPSIEEDGLLGSSSMAVGIGLIALALLIAGAVLAFPGRGKVRLDAAPPRQKEEGTAVAGLAQRATLVAERAIAASERRRTIDALLEQGGITMRAAEVIVIAAAAGFGLAMLGAMLVGPLGFVLGILPLLTLQPVLGIFANRRREAFADQLDGLLQMIAGGLRAGYGLLQAIEAASEELEDPAGAELARFTTEVRLGRDVIDALDALAVRVGNDDFAWVARAIRIHREVGGDLSEVLDRVSETIRARARVQRQVKALSAEGRLSARVLLALPFVLALAMTVLNPSFIGPLFTTALGFLFLAIAAVLMTVGSLWLKRLVRPVF